MTYDDDTTADQTGNSVPGLTEPLGLRIKRVMKDIGIDASVESTGKSARTLDRYVSGVEPPMSVITNLAERSGYSLLWLATGQGSMIPAPSDGGLEGRGKTGHIDDLTLIERLDVEASAGLGMYVDTEKTLDFIAFQTSWLRRKGINPAATRLLNVKGDSMEPTIRDGDMALVDTSICDIIDNSIYVIIVGQSLLIKRIHVLVTGALRLISDNNMYSPEDVQPNEAEFVRIAGRVMWYGRSI